MPFVLYGSCLRHDGVPGRELIEVAEHFPLTWLGKTWTPLTIARTGPIERFFFGIRCGASAQGYPLRPDSLLDAGSRRSDPRSGPGLRSSEASTGLFALATGAPRRSSTACRLNAHGRSPSYRNTSFGDAVAASC